MALNASHRPRSVGSLDRHVRRLVGAALLTTLAVAASACCNPAKSPGRCTACVYDNCIVPTFASTGMPAPSRDVLPVDDASAREGGVQAAAMAY